MKLILENWREYLNEEEDLLEEGWKDWVMAGLMGLSALTLPSPASAAGVASSVAGQVQQSYFADSLSVEEKLLIRGALWQWSKVRKSKGKEGQGILKAVWTLQVPKDSTPETDKYLKGALKVLSKEDPALIEIYKKFGKRIIVLEHTQTGSIQKLDQKTQRLERKFYKWSKPDWRRKK